MFSTAGVNNKIPCNEYFIGDVILCSEIYSLNPLECSNNVESIDHITSFHNYSETTQKIFNY